MIRLSPRAKPRRNRLSNRRRLQLHRNVIDKRDVWSDERASALYKRLLSAAQGGGPAQPRPKHLTLEEREEIMRRLAIGRSFREIARELGRAPSTISREVARSGGRSRYRALSAEMAFCRNSLRPKAPKLNSSPGLCAKIEELMSEQQWSPQQVAASLRLSHPDDPQMHVSHETIYKHLFVQARGSFRKQLNADLRSGRTARRPEGSSPASEGPIKDKVMISERPAEVEDRAVPGHWEGDLILGKGNKSAIVTLVERSTRFVMLAEIGRDRTSEHVLAAIKGQITRLPAHLVKSLTWDQGAEMAGHKEFTVETDVQVYFCDPRSPWQRGSNENTNGLLRQYFPKGTDLSVHSQEHLDEVARKLNTRPRQTLGWLNPSQKMEELLR